MGKILREIKRQFKAASKDIPTVPIEKYQNSQEDPIIQPAIQPEMYQLEIGCAQSNGRQRDHNEDAMFALTTNLSDEQHQALIGLFMVADGMGGHKHGEIASDLAVRTISNLIIRKLFSPLLSITPTTPNESIQEMLEDSIQEAHRTIMKHAPGGGTTVTALLVFNEQVTFVHVGDSRAYSISQTGEINVLTRDHSLVMRMIELGQLTEDEAASHPQRNVLYRALGQGEPFSPDIGTIPVPRPGYLLVCSDGLWSVVPEDIIVNIITTITNPQSACQLLINAANDHGGPDNITAILIKIPE